MSAQHIFDHAPLGALIRYFDGASEPERLGGRREWERCNGAGLLTRKTPAIRTPDYAAPASFSLRTDGLQSGVSSSAQGDRMFEVTSSLNFEVADLPKPGMIRILSDFNGMSQLVHLAPDMATAQAWLRERPPIEVVFERVDV